MTVKYEKLRLVSVASDGRTADLLHAGEPFFLLRGQDALAIPTLYAYSGLLVVVVEGHVTTPLDDGLVEAFASWQRANPGLVKVPD